MKDILAEEFPGITAVAARKLMTAAMESFAERGYHATTTRDIALAAGMSPAALYVHFPSKVAVLAAISRSGHAQALALAEAAATADGTPADRMRTLVANMAAWHATNHRVARIVQYELQALPEPDYAIVADLRRRTERTVRDLISDGVEDGQFTADPKTAARAIMSLCIDIARWYTPTTSPPPPELGARYATLALAMLGIH